MWHSLSTRVSKFLPGTTVRGNSWAIGIESWRRANVNELTDPDNLDPISGFPVFKALLCEVVEAET